MKRLVSTLLALITFFACQKPEAEDSKDLVLPGTVEHFSMHSTDLNRVMKTTVWLPAGYDASKTYPFLYLLHGYGDDNDSWINKGAAASIADRYIHEGGLPMVIVMPDGLTSFYTGSYENYMHEHLMPALEEKYHCNGKRAVAGLSMGGYGTLYYSLKYPEKYTYGYAMSPASDLDGFRILAGKYDAFDYPKLTVESGTQDYTVSISSVRALVSMLQSYQLRVDFIERSGGHDWGFWPVCLEKALVKIEETFK